MGASISVAILVILNHLSLLASNVSTCVFNRSPYGSLLPLALSIDNTASWLSLLMIVLIQDLFNSSHVMTQYFRLFPDAGCTKNPVVLDVISWCSIVRPHAPCTEHAAGCIKLLVALHHWLHFSAVPVPGFPVGNLQVFEHFSLTVRGKSAFLKHANGFKMTTIGYASRPLHWAVVSLDGSKNTYFLP